MSYHKFKIAVLLFVSSVLIGGIYADHLPHRDFYPFFSWSLFSNSSNDDTSFFIRLKTYDGEPNATIIFAGNVSEYMDIDFLPDYYWNVQEGALKVREKGDDSDISTLALRFKKKPVVYEVIEARYDAMQLKSGGVVKDVKIIKEFETE